MENNLNISPAEYELIEGWLEGTLSDSQREEVKVLENEDPDWLIKVEQIKVLREDLESILVKAELEKIHEEVIGKSPSKTYPFPRWILAVAATVSLILVGWWGFQSVFQSSNEKLFVAYYQTDPGLITAMSGSDSYEFDRGMVDFKEGKYREALVRWELLLEEDPADDTLLYFVAMAHLEMENYPLSQELLKQVADEDSSEFKEDASWYLALIYLKKGEMEAAKLILSNLEKPEAQELLQKIQE
ncbi:tetratricopeptide repeat protein [Algoriphagus confluentis]|uniref:Tetratricopeptide repeat protein n=1 Tax=Algoriphagus confluentis TaxID=1697556 RepID=A0ABQ6PQ59_9BACT|nr:hypothetical protein Aconfl_27670 [Algoriphagus confluentis]